MFDFLTKKWPKKCTVKKVKIIFDLFPDIDDIDKIQMDSYYRV